MPLKVDAKRGGGRVKITKGGIEKNQQQQVGKKGYTIAEEQINHNRT